MFRARFTASFVALAVFASVAGIVFTRSTAAADEAGSARSYAYGIAQEGPGEDDLQPAPEVEAKVGPGTSASDKSRSQFDQDQLVGLLQNEVVVSKIRADACLVPGVSEKLQAREDRAEYLARGGNPAMKTAPPERAEVFYPPGFPDGDRCVTPKDGATDSPSGSPSPAPVAPGQPTAQTPDGQKNCEDPKLVTDPAKPDYSRTCYTTLPLWNARAYTKTLDVLVFDELESEAVARCEGGQVLYSSAMQYGTASGVLVADTEQPNQRLNPGKLGLTDSAVVTMWETNWDPTTNKTVDGSDTVWVNALHVRTPTQDIVIGHAEATATCPAAPAPTPTVTVTAAPAATPPPGGYPRDVDLEPSRAKIRWGANLTFNGSVTPDAQFETPRACVENVPVTIRRDVVGGAEEFADMGTVRTDSAGQFSFNYTADVGANWVAFIDKDVPIDCAQASSEARTVLVQKRPALRISDTSVRRGQMVTFTLSFMPCEGHEGAPLGLLQAIGGRSALIARKKSDEQCTAVFKRRMKRSASFQALARKTDEDHLAAKSRQKAVIVNGGGRRG